MRSLRDDVYFLGQVLPRGEGEVSAQERFSLLLRERLHSDFGVSTVYGPSVLEKFPIALAGAIRRSGLDMYDNGEIHKPSEWVDASLADVSEDGDIADALVRSTIEYLDMLFDAQPVVLKSIGDRALVRKHIVATARVICDLVREQRAAG